MHHSEPIDRFYPSFMVSFSFFIFLLAFSQLLAAPFAFGVVFLKNPTMAFISLLITFAFGEAYLGVCIAIVTTMVATEYRTFAVAVFIFVSGNIGGNATLLVPELSAALPNGLQDALTILYCSGYLVAALVFFITLLRLRHHQNLHTPVSILNDVAIDDDEQFQIPSSPMSDDDDERALLVRDALGGPKRSRPRHTTLAKVDDADMATCQSYSQAIAVNWRRSSIESSDSDAAARVAASAPAHLQQHFAMRTYNSTDTDDTDT